MFWLSRAKIFKIEGLNFTNILRRCWFILRENLDFRSSVSAKEFVVVVVESDFPTTLTWIPLDSGTGVPRQRSAGAIIATEPNTNLTKMTKRDDNFWSTFDHFFWKASSIFKASFAVAKIDSSLKLRCDSRFQRAFTACICVFKEITLVWANQRNFFENATTCRKRMRKMLVATQLKTITKLTITITITKLRMSKHLIRTDRLGRDSQNFLRKFLIFFVTLGLQILRL